MSVFTRETVLSTAKPVARPRTALWRVAAVLGFMGLIAVGAHAKIAVPWTPVPITLQTFFVLLAGALLGPLDGIVAVAGYIVMGVFGVPIFAKAGGPVGLSYLSGVTGGYLIGFLACAAFLGIAVRRTQSRGLQLVLFFAASQLILWTMVNYTLVWGLLVVGGYRVAEAINTVLSLLFTVCLALCAVAVLPQATGELARGLVPQVPKSTGEWLMLMALSGIVMSGSTTVFYSVWAEERQMGMFGFARRLGRPLTRREIEPHSEEEVRNMRGWLRVNRINVALAYLLGAMICLSTFVLGVAVLRPAGVTLSGAKLAPELSLMMTRVAGSWSKPVFYLGAYAAVISTAVGILDGGPRMYAQPLRRLLPVLFEKLSPAAGHRIIMTLMVAGSGTVYVLVPDALKLVVWMGAVDAPLVGLLIATYAYLARCYVPSAYRRGLIWTLAMACIGFIYFAFGLSYPLQELSGG